MTKPKEENRLDRLDRLAEETFARFDQLGKYQAETSKQIRDLREYQAETSEQIRKLREAQDRTDEQLNRTDDQLNKTIRKLDRIGVLLGDLGLVQGEVAEDLFYRNLKGVFRKAKLELRKVKRNLKRKGEGEYDLVAVDGGRVLVVEVKNKLEKRMVDKFLEEKLPRFKELFPEYERYQVIGGMGALVVKDDVGRYAEKSGLYVLTQTDGGGATLLNREGFQPRTFN